MKFIYIKKKSSQERLFLGIIFIFHIFICIQILIKVKHNYYVKASIFIFFSTFQSAS